MYIVQMLYLVEKIVVTLMQARDDGRRGQGEERTAGGVDSKEVNWRSGQLQGWMLIKRAVFTLKVVAF